MTKETVRRMALDLPKTQIHTELLLEAPCNQHGDCFDVLFLAISTTNATHHWGTNLFPPHEYLEKDTQGDTMNH